MSNFASHSVPAVIPGPDAPETKPTGINPVAEIPDKKPDTPAIPQRPDHIPEKFWDAEKGVVRTDELAKSYAELEKVKADKKPDADPEKAKADAEKAKAEADKAKANEPKPGELPQHFAKFNDEFAEKGQLSDESYKELAEKHGLSRDYVDVYISGLQAKQADYTNAVAEAAGGKEQMDALFEWAGKTLNESELEAANKALSSGDKATAALAVRGLVARFQTENGKEPSLINGDRPDAGVKPFGSTAEVVKAMSDPRYKNDPAYRKEIEDRLAISSVI